MPVFILIRTAGLNLIPSRGHPPRLEGGLCLETTPADCAPERTVRWRQGTPCGAERRGRWAEGAAVSPPKPGPGRGAGGARAGGGAGGGAQAPGTHTFQPASRVSAAARPPRAALGGPDRGSCRSSLEPSGLDAAVDRVGLARGVWTPAEPRPGRRRAERTSRHPRSGLVFPPAAESSCCVRAPRPSPRRAGVARRLSSGSGPSARHPPALRPLPRAHATGRARRPGARAAPAGARLAPRGTQRKAGASGARTSRARSRSRPPRGFSERR